MKKDYKEWFKFKPIVNNIENNIRARTGEIWYCHWGTNVGSEFDGKGQNSIRPVLIIKKTSPNTFLCLPLTSNGKDLPMYFKLNSFNTKSSIVLDQIRSIDSKRFFRFIEQVSDKELKNIIDKLVHYIKGETPLNGGESRRSN